MAGPSLPERLLAARERKGVDLYRAERDTKIRASTSARSRRGDYAELPGAVYTKGFLRNYALYLGLDPDDVIRQWRRERGDARCPPEPVLAVPRPLEAPRQGLTFSPVVVVAALLTVFIGVFAVYLGLQLVRFAKPPTIAVTTPATAVIEVAEDDDPVHAQAARRAERDGHDHGGRPRGPAAGLAPTPPGAGSQTCRSAAAGTSSTISALDPETGKQSEGTAKVFITVPFIVLEAPTLDDRLAGGGGGFENGASR